MRHIGDVTHGMGNPQPRGVPDPYAGGFMTKHGWLSFEDIGAADGRVVTDAHRHRLIQFPYATTAQGRPLYREIPAHKLDEGEALNADSRAEKRD